MSMYILVRWLHNDSNDPILLYSELDSERYETRKVEVFRDGKVGIAGPGLEFNGSILGTVPVPSLEEIASDSQFIPQEIRGEEFETIWRVAKQVAGRDGAA